MAAKGLHVAQDQPPSPSAPTECGSPWTVRVGRGHAVLLLALAAGAILGLGVAFLTPVFALLALVGLACGVAIFLRPELGVLGFIVVANVLPFAVLPVRLVFSPTIVDAVLTSLLAAWVFWALYRSAPLVGTPLNVLILLYLGLAVTAFVLGLTYSISPERVRLFMKSVNSTLFFFSVVNCVRARASLNRSVLALLLGGSVAAAIALVIQFLPESTAAALLSSLGVVGYPTGPDVLRPVAGTEVLRAIGTSIDPNVLGGLLMMVGALLAGQIFSGKPLLQKRWLWVMALPVGSALMLTQSRGAMGGLVVAVLVVGGFRDRRLCAAILGTGIATVLFGGLVGQILPLAAPFLGRIQSGLAFQDPAAAMRLNEYANALRTISEYPWFGIGFGDPPSIDLFLGVSSIYLLIGQEMGLIGLAAFMAILGVLGVQLVRALRATRDEELHGVLVSLAAALASAATAGLLDQYYVNILFPHMIALFWLYVALAMVAVKLSRER